MASSYYRFEPNIARLLCELNELNPTTWRDEIKVMDQITLPLDLSIALCHKILPDIVENETAWLPFYVVYAPPGSGLGVRFCKAPGHSCAQIESLPHPESMCSPVSFNYMCFRVGIGILMLVFCLAMCYQQSSGRDFHVSNFSTIVLWADLVQFINFKASVLCLVPVSHLCPLLVQHTGMLLENWK
jgi:hypothetical protein